jgi:hypothetical protein
VKFSQRFVKNEKTTDDAYRRAWNPTQTYPSQLNHLLCIPRRHPRVNVLSRAFWGKQSFWNV